MTIRSPFPTAVRVATLSACLVAGTATAYSAGSIKVLKFYDANANGVRDAGEPGIGGWPMRLRSDAHSLKSVRPTGSTGYHLRSPLPAGSDYSMTEATPNEGHWVQSTPRDSHGNAINPQTGVAVRKGLATCVTLGNDCASGSGGRTPGFWSKRNGEARMADEADGMLEGLSMLSALHLVTDRGAAFDPSTYPELRT